VSRPTTNCLTGGRLIYAERVRDVRERTLTGHRKVSLPLGDDQILSLSVDKQAVPLVCMYKREQFVLATFVLRRVCLWR
jgi:hypothetical protein